MGIKLRTKLALLYALLFVTLLGVCGLSVYRLMALRMTAAADDNLVDHLAGLWGYVKFREEEPVLEYDLNDSYQSYFVNEATRYYQLYDAASGSLILASDPSRSMRQVLAPAQVRKLVAHPGIDTLDSGSIPLRFRSAVFHAEGRSYLLRVGVSVEQDLDDLRSLRNVLILLLPITTLLAALGAWWMAGRGLQPLRHLQQEASAISITQLGLRLRDRGTGDELDSLAATFNQMLARLESNVAQMRNFAEFMAHELRTPMTILRGEADVELMRPDLPHRWRSHLESQIEEFDKLNLLINRFLLLAKAESGAIKMQREPTNLSDAVRSVVATFAPAAEAAGVSVSFAGPAQVDVIADRQWIERALMNLLDNALKFTSAGGSISIVTELGTDGALVRVSDTGQGIHPRDLPHVFEHSYRAVDSEPQTSTPGGLGLALAKWIVEQHLGTIRVESTLGTGTQFTVELPGAVGLHTGATAEVDSIQDAFRS